MTFKNLGTLELKHLTRYDLDLCRQSCFHNFFSRFTIFLSDSIELSIYTAREITHLPSVDRTESGKDTWWYFKPRKSKKEHWIITMSKRNWVSQWHEGVSEIVAIEDVDQVKRLDRYLWEVIAFELNNSTRRNAKQKPTF